jgi:hypothetical protein
MGDAMRDSMVSMDDLLLTEAELPEALQSWLETAPTAAFAVSLERLADGRLLLRPLPEASPELLARLRVTMAKYREALMNLT